MTDAAWAYPSLGFDPLPGDPSVAQSLRDDARIFGQRMTEEAKRLRHLAHRDGWQGEAADSFAEHLDKLPRDLQRCGDAFSELALALGNYYAAFTGAKAKAHHLERRATEARQSLQSADLAFSSPVIQPPGDCPAPRDRRPLHAAEDELGAILREAHEFADRFDESPEVQDIARAIRSLSEFAPDGPRFSILKRWAGDVFKATPIGAAYEAVQAVHGLINHYAEFFSDLADFLSDLSGTLGLLSLPLLLVPPVGTAFALGALATAAGTATIKTSLYVGKARDARGNLYVSGGELAFAMGDVAINAAGIGMAAKATQAVGAGSGLEKSFGKALAEQLDPNLFKRSWTTSKGTLTAVGDDGFKSVGKELLTEARAEWQIMGDKGTQWVRGGVGLAVAGPSFTMAGNWAGIESARALPKDFLKVLTNQSDDLELAATPVASTPVVSAPRATPNPVMGN
jgi:uncharacterized protein YukE